MGGMINERHQALPVISIIDSLRETCNTGPAASHSVRASVALLGLAAAEVVQICLFSLFVQLSCNNCLTKDGKSSLTDTPGTERDSKASLMHFQSSVSEDGNIRYPEISNLVVSWP
jgi:hypothetical protein